MPQGGHGRHQVNVQGLAVGVQLQNVLRREGGIIPPDFTEAVKEEGVFDIQVQLIELVEAAPIRQIFQERHGGNAAPSDVVE